MECCPYSVSYSVRFQEVLGGNNMSDLILDLYSNGDLYMMAAKIFAWMIMLLFLAVILGCFRGLRL